MTFNLLALPVTLGAIWGKKSSPKNTQENPENDFSKAQVTFTKYIKNPNGDVEVKESPYRVKLSGQTTYHSKDQSTLDSNLIKDAKIKYLTYDKEAKRYEFKFQNGNAIHIYPDERFIENPEKLYNKLYRSKVYKIKSCEIKQMTDTTYDVKFIIEEIPRCLNFYEILQIKSKKLFHANINPLSPFISLVAAVEGFFNIFATAFGSTPFYERTIEDDIFGAFGTSIWHFSRSCSGHYGN